MKLIIGTLMGIFIASLLLHFVFGVSVDELIDLAIPFMIGYFLRIVQIKLTK